MKRKKFKKKIQTELDHEVRQLVFDVEKDRKKLKTKDKKGDWYLLGKTQALYEVLGVIKRVFKKKKKNYGNYRRPPHIDDFY